jgi:hypothetical protein
MFVVLKKKYIFALSIMFCIVVIHAYLKRE